MPDASLPSPAVEKLSVWLALTEEALIDMGMEPPPGYWERELRRQIKMRRVRTRVRVWWFGLTREISHRLSHAWGALRGRECDA
jgi:hypothetical protein